MGQLGALVVWRRLLCRHSKLSGTLNAPCRQSSPPSDKERLGKILMQVADQNKAICARRLEALAPTLDVISALSLIVLMVVVNLYSIVPFSELILKMMDEASSLN